VKLVLKIGVVWLIGAVVFASFLSYDNLISLLRLRNGVRTIGTVTALEPNNHRAVHYAYIVAGVNRSGVGMAGYGNPGFGALSVGREVVVYYSRANPNESCVGIPNELITSEIPPIVGAAVTFPIMIISAFAWSKDRFRRWLLS
jgi:hypothetical protein